MNLQFIANIAKEHPAIARMLEAMIISVATYIVTAVYSGQLIDSKAAIAALITPLYLGLTKYQRDNTTDSTDTSNMA